MPLAIAVDCEAFYNNAMPRTPLPTKTIFLNLIVFALLGFVRDVNAQDKPSDFLNQIPEIMTGICSASSAQVQAYGDKLEAFGRKLTARLDAIRTLKAKSMSGAKLNPNVNVTSVDNIERQLEQARQADTYPDLSEEFYQAMHTDAEASESEALEALSLKLKAALDAGDSAAMDAVSAEMTSVRRAYCQAASPHYIDLLNEQRSKLKSGIASMVAVDDLQEQWNCKTLGCTYYPELAYERALVAIADHLAKMTLLVTFSACDK